MSVAVIEDSEVGSSSDVPDETGAYHLFLVDDDGTAALNADDGTADSESLEELSSCRGALARMTEAVLAQMPEQLRDRACIALARRWARQWRVALP